MLFFFSSMQSVAQVIPDSLVGRYTGRLYDIKMGEKSGFNEQTMTFTLSSDGLLCAELEQIGKMPGLIYLAIPVSVGADGTLIPTGDNVGKMKMTMFPFPSFSLYLNYVNRRTEALYSASLRQSVLRFTLRVRGSILGFSAFPVQVSFEGEKIEK